jgi:hypothetical protein
MVLVPLFLVASLSDAQNRFLDSVLELFSQDFVDLRIFDGRQ